MKRLDIAMLLALAAIWGGSFLFIRMGAPALGPLPLMELRVAIAGLALLPAALAAYRSHLGPGSWRKYLVLGALNAALPFSLIATAELHLSAALASILNATTPLFTALIAAIWLGERLSPRKIVGLIGGVAGVGLVVGWTQVDLTPTIWLSIGGSLLAALFYGLGGVYTKRACAGTPPLALATGQQLGAAVVLLPLSATQVPAAMPSWPIIAAVLALALACTSLGYLLYFQLIQRVGPTKTLSVTFLVPVFGMLWGKLFLGEQIGWGHAAGLAVILLSVGLVTDVRLRTASRVAAEKTAS